MDGGTSFRISRVAVMNYRLSISMISLHKLMIAEFESEYSLDLMRKIFCTR